MTNSIPPAGPERRTELRYVPPADSELILKPTGLGGLLSGNLVQLWVDISEGGLQAIISRRTHEGAVLQARIVHKPSGQAFDVAVSARHVAESQKFPGSFVVGFRFVSASPELRACIRQRLSRFPAVPRPTPAKPRPTS